MFSKGVSVISASPHHSAAWSRLHSLDYPGFNEKKRLKHIKNSEVKAQSPDNAAGKNDRSTEFHFAVKWIKRFSSPLQ